MARSAVHEPVWGAERKRGSQELKYLSSGEEMPKQITAGGISTATAMPL